MSRGHVYLVCGPQYLDEYMAQTRCLLSNCRNKNWGDFNNIFGSDSVISILLLILSAQTRSNLICGC